MRELAGDRGRPLHGSVGSAHAHTALDNQSTCASDHMSRYLTKKTLPPKGTRCEQDQVPFQSGS
jgi:hypothetical protein